MAEDPNDNRAKKRTPLLFGSAPFLRFFVGQTLSFCGEGFRALALPLLVFRMTRTESSVAVTFALETLPYALSGLVGGSLSDRLNRRGIMLACNGARVAIMLIMVIAYATNALSLVMIYTCVVLLSISGALFLNCQMPSIPFLLGKVKTPSGVASLFAAEQSTNLIAPPVGGVILSAFGPLPLLTINAFAYLVSQVAIASVDNFGPELRSSVPRIREVGEDIAFGFRFISADAKLRAFAAVHFFVNVLSTMGFVTIIPYLKQELAATDQLVGIALGAMAAGGLAGSLTSRRRLGRLGMEVGLAFLGDALSWIPVIWTQSTAVVILCISLSSGFFSYALSTLVSWRLRVIPNMQLGRILGINRFFVLIGILPGSLLGGVIGDRLGVRSAILVAATGYLLTSVIVLSVKGLRTEDG